MKLTSKRIRLRLAQWMDQAGVAASMMVQTRYYASSAREPGEVAIAFVSYNTLQLTQLMLLTLADKCSRLGLAKIVVVDNGSRDGSGEFLTRLAKGGRFAVIHNRVGATTHAAGLRRLMQHFRDEDRQLGSRATEFLLIVDSDIIFLRDDLVGRLREALDRPNAALAGELQFDAGEPYVHVSCMMLRRSICERPRIWPFVDHGAPGLWMQRSLVANGYRLMDVPVRAEEYIVHRGRGTIDAIGRAASSELRAPHFHGNQNGRSRWDAALERHAGRLGPGTAAEAAAAYILEKLPS